MATLKQVLIGIGLLICLFGGPVGWSILAVIAFIRGAHSQRHVKRAPPGSSFWFVFWRW